MQLPDWNDQAARTAWLREMVIVILRREHEPLTLSKLTFAVNCFSNPRRYKKKGEYKFPHEEVEALLNALVADYVLETDDARRKYDPQAGRRRYWFANTLNAIAKAAAEGD